MKATIEPQPLAKSGLRSWRPVILMALVVACWASATVATKYLFNRQLVSPYTLVVCRFTFASLFTLTIFRLRLARPVSVKASLIGGPRAYLLGGLFISSFIICFNLSLQFLTATLAGLFFYGLVPMIMLVIGHYWLGTTFGAQQIIGILIGLAGVLLVISGGDWQHLIESFRSSNLPLGLGILTIAALGWGAYSLWGKRYNSPDTQASLLSTGLNQLIGVAPVWVLMAVFEPGNIFALSLEAWLFILYIAIIPSSLAFVIFNAILKDLSLEQASAIQLLSPAFTAGMAIAFLGEPFSLALVFGTVILLLGIRVSTWKGKVNSSNSL